MIILRCGHLGVKFLLMSFGQVVKNLFCILKGPSHFEILFS